MRSVPGVKDSAHLKQDLPASQCVGTLGVNMSAHLRVRKAIVGLSAGCVLFLCGGEDYVDMSEFAHVRARDFNLLTDNDTSPSPDTFERLMSAVCPEELRRCLSEHGRSFLSSLGEKQVAIDGKKLRGASPRTNGTRGDYILSAYVTENHLLVGQESVTDKENEIPAIPRLLDRLDIDGAVVSIDAAGTQTAIAERILEGNAFIAFALVLLFFLMIYFLNRRLFMDHRKFWYLIFIFIIASVLALIINKFAPRCLYMVPFTLTALYLEAFFKNKVIFPICCVSFLPLLVFAENGVVLFVMFLLASIVAVFTFRFFNQGWQQFIMSGIVFVSILVTYFGFRMIDMVNDDPYMAVLYMFIGSMLIVAGYPLIYLFERMFNLVSSSRLRELCDTNNKLLRELEHKAPGTFQHSLQVMNMCDAAARAIDANVLLVRAGALYHDIGKMKNPLCFIENESMSPKGVHYHEHLSPKESARAIIKHVSDGLELAAENRLPDVIQDFILTHHGTSNTSYFYNKYLNEGGDPNDVSDFFYKGRKPQTKEQIILMICDTLEAASRTLKDNSAATFSVFVENIVASKMKIGQFDQADISIKDLNTVKETLKAYLSQIYHERVVYPQRKNN